MKKVLTKQNNDLYYYVNGERVNGANTKITGDCSELRGNCSGLRGDLDSAEITDADRENGIDINDLII